MNKFKTGDIVTVGKAYVGGGHYQNDDATGGPYTIIKPLPNPYGVIDYYIVRGVVAKSELTTGMYDYIITEGRLKRRRRKRIRLTITAAD